MTKKILFVMGGLLFLSFSSLVGAEEPAKEKPLPTELPIVVVKGTDRSYLEVIRTRAFALMPIRGEKSMIGSFLEATLGKKTYSHFLSFPGLEKREEGLPSAEIFLKEREEIPPIALIEPRLSGSFLSYTPTKYMTMRAKEISLMPVRGEKALVRFFPGATLGKKTYSPSLPFPGLEKREEGLPSAEIFLKERKEIPPIALIEPRLSRLSVSYTPARYIATRVKALSLMPIRGEKSLTEAFVKFPPRERAYRPLSKEESPLPYLYISGSLAADDNFNYRLDYGRKKDKMIHFLSLGRYSAPQWTTYEEDGSVLAKDEDWLNTRFIWNFAENKNALFSINGYQKKMDLPEEKKRKKDKVGLAGELTFKLQGGNILKVSGWVQSTEVGEDGVSYQDTNPGAQLELEIPQVPLNVGISAENSSYAEKSQFHLWIKDEAIVFKSIKGLSLGLEVGIKRIEGGNSEVLPHLKLTEQFNPKLQLQIEAKKKLYLPEFDDLYLSRDYIDYNSILLIDRDYRQLTGY